MSHHTIDLSKKPKTAEEIFLEATLGKYAIKSKLSPRKESEPEIIIQPYYPVCLYDNYYTLHLGYDIYLDPDRTKKAVRIPLFGYFAQPCEVFYCESWESVKVEKFVPFLYPSTLAHLHGMEMDHDFDPSKSIHDGKLQFTLTTERQTTFSPGMPIANLYFMKRDKLKNR